MPDDIEPLPTACVVPSDAALRLARELLSRGEVVALPTETVYGLAADATNSAAVARIFEAKGRPAHNPLIVHVSETSTSVAAFEGDGLVRRPAVTDAMRATADALITSCWPGPLTLVLPRGSRIPEIVSGGLPTTGFRMPAHPVIRELLAKANFPLAAPSANRSNRVSPTTAAHVMYELAGRIPLVIDGGPSRVGVESTIVRVDDGGRVQLLRPGGTPIEHIERVLGTTTIPAPSPSGPVLASGMMQEHYAPQTPLILIDARRAEDLARRVAAVTTWKSAPRVGVLRLAGPPATPSSWIFADHTIVTTIRSLGDHGDGALAAHGLFDAMRALDDVTLDVIVVEAPDDQRTGLWPAIADRLQRAGSRWNVPRPH